MLHQSMLIEAWSLNGARVFSSSRCEADAGTMEEKDDEIKLPIIARGAIKVAGLTFRVGFWGGEGDGEGCCWCWKGTSKMRSEFKEVGVCHL